MKRYAGERFDDGSVRVIVCDDTLYGEMFARWSELPAAEPVEDAPVIARLSSLDIVPQGRGASPFAWGREDAGGIALSRAILTDCLGSGQAEGLYQDFEWAVVRGLASDTWELDEELIRGFGEIQPIVRAARTGADVQDREAAEPLCP